MREYEQGRIKAGVQLGGEGGCLSEAAGEPNELLDLQDGGIENLLL